MAHRYFGRRLTAAWRLFWRCVAGLLVFAQVAAAADLCVSIGGQTAPDPPQIASGYAAGVASADCVSDVPAPDQAPVADPGNAISALLGPPPATSGPSLLLSRSPARRWLDVAPVHRVSPNLLFLNLRL